MSQENLCLHNKFGFCKFGEKCFRVHENKVCENDKCSIQNCSLRHPRFCRYFGKFNNCKFGTYCKFRHESFGNKRIFFSKEPASAYYDDEVKKLAKKLEDCAKKIEEKEREIKILDKVLSERICELGRTKTLKWKMVNSRIKMKILKKI